MASLAEYFKANRYSGKYNIGDRVIVNGTRFHSLVLWVMTH